MGLVPGKNFRIYIAGYDVSGQANKVTPAAGKRTFEDATVATSTGKQWYPILGDHGFNADLFYDRVFSGSGQALDAMRTLTTNSAVLLVLGNGTAQGTEAILGEGKLEDYPIDMPVGGLVKVTMPFKFNDVADYGLLLSINQSWTADGVDTTYDLGAAGSAGGKAVLQVFNVSPNISTVDVDIRESTDNFVGDDTQLVAFTQVTGDSVAELKNFTGTVKRYQRVQLATTRSDGESWYVIMAVGLYVA